MPISLYLNPENMDADFFSKYLFGFFLFTLLLSGNENCSAQSTEQESYNNSKLQESPIKKTDWEEQKGNYEYVKDGVKKKEEKKKEESPSDLNSDSPKDSDWKPNLDSNTARIILVSVVLAILVLLIVLLLRRSNWVFNKKVNENNLLISQLEENLPESDIEPHLQKALNEKDYRLAFRLYFLLLIQQLSLHHQVKWRREKTNGEYLVECRSKKYYESFSLLTFAFDRVWYGDYSISEKEFSEYQRQFQSILHQLKQPQ